ncbi:N-acetylmannosamine-6-phosphate 2-epimerase [Lacticaseibacillus pantheris]|uniref:N-acetylmannosamine-6-phosphate 2-epimerase n=1 Tax=Lacticaseibacillus pantheris TaxID=171523 RepID=UPI00265A692E|nr:putative N-acetylmannosamine-6-phosphate 2-epimerase [Lacticaseibacillus pantheris]WKF84163.1 putative N-acetylmannosamine-6-phosphate 2-epimerase [Lacticaseibacillus pantheris]
MINTKVMEQLHNGLIVSCQARKGWAMYGKDIMAAFADAAARGGAVGIRATEPENIAAIQKKVQLPIIGIYKQWYDGFDVYITPTFASAEAIIQAGAQIVALDGTNRLRPNNEYLPDIIQKIHDQYPEIMVMADCDNLTSAKFAVESGADIVSSTLAGYTEATKKEFRFNPTLIAELATLGVPVIAEGHIHTQAELRAAYDAGATSVVIGTAITRPEIITEGFVKSIADL